jgi:outer membrane receptor protein involved in Fe transport
MESMKKKLFFLSCLLPVSLALAQAAEIKGRVVNTLGLPVAEAVVAEKTTGVRAVTDADGRFSLGLEIKDRQTLIVTHPDFWENEVTLSARDARKDVTIVLTPFIRQNEEVFVTALRYPEPTTKIPAAGTVIPTSVLEERMAPNITEVLTGIPGVVPLGSGGFSLVPTIRGLGRSRILIMIDNARVVSDRRTGPNASFVSPEDIARIEVLRSPSSIFYGSDAIGGVVQMFMKGATEEGIHGAVHAGYGTNNAEAKYGLSLSGKKGEFGFYFSYQAENADNYSSPLGEVLRTSFTQASLFGKLSYESDRRRFSLSILGARGTDIGKPTRSSLTKPTWYPRENQNLVQLHWTETGVLGGEVNFQAFANPNFLETQTDQIDAGTKSKETYAKTQSTEYGVQLSYAKKWGDYFRLTGGVDYFGRAAAKADNKETSFDSQGNVTKTFVETPFTDGRRGDIGFYLSADYSGLKNMDIVGGIRWDHLVQSAHPGGGADALDSRREAWTGFLAVSYKIGDRVTAFANVSKAYRVPGLSELFYSGITGRGFIIAQPNLKPEDSLNGDIGLRVTMKRFFVGVYGFSYRIDGLIDRYLVADKTYTYLNVDSAQIRGIETEVEYYPFSGWKIFGNMFVLHGENRMTGQPINDIPPVRLFVGSRVWFGRLSMEVSGTFQGKKDKPGPAEIAIPDYEYFQLKASYAWHSLSFYAALMNVFDKTFLGRPDPDAMEEPSRRLVLGLNYGF